MLPFPLIYHDGYDLKFGAHVFPSQKYRLIRACLIDEFVAGPEDFLTPEQATVEQLLLVHTPDWVGKLQSGKLTYHEILKLEVPYSRKMVEAFFLAAGGTLLAARKALQHGIGFNIGGGFHHAFPGHGEGFCAINDMAVAIRVLQQEHLIRTALIIDCDVHHGNGTAAVFAHDPSVFTISIHHFNNYPTEKPPSTVDIHLGDGVGDQEYLEKLRSTYDTAVCGFRPDLVVYVAGSDPYYDDKLGGLSLTREGLYLRDRVVFDAALRQHVPVAVTLAGGYARKLEDTVTLHMRTVKAALESYHEFGWKSDAD
ncbi:histone deacetylase family protein [Paludibaculum fermentans]|uniref:histone deacetylase family protein n=1 Tax=Paludibaculum fermentans TaxID=1473598 RepID=UPI003EBD2C51